MEHAPTLLDVAIGLLQSMAVLLLATGVYVALVVRKTGDSSVSARPTPSPHGQPSLAAPRADSPGT